MTESTSKTASPPTFRSDSIYPGLRPYNEKESELFTGRNYLIDEIKYKLNGPRLLTIIGGPASGKSSLINAGLIPQLREGYRLNGESKWLIAPVILREDPIRSICSAFGEIKYEDGNSFNQAEVRTLIKSGSSDGILKAYDIMSRGDSYNLLIVLDQFDDFFAYYNNEKELEDLNEPSQETNSTTANNSERISILRRQSLINQLLVATSKANYPIYVIVCMRPKNLAEASKFRGLSEAISRNQLLLPNLKGEEIKANIVSPIKFLAKNHDQSFYKDKYEFKHVATKNEEVDTAEKFANDYWTNFITRNKSPFPVPPSIIQFGLKHIWENAKTNYSGEKKGKALSKDDFHPEINHLEEAISLHANDVYDKLDGLSEIKINQKIAKRIFQTLMIRVNDNFPKGKPINFNDLFALISVSEDTDTEEVKKEISWYKQRLRNVLFSNQIRKNDIFLIKIFKRIFFFIKGLLQLIFTKKTFKEIFIHKESKYSEKEFKHYWEKKDEIGKIVSSSNYYLGKGRIINSVREILQNEDNNVLLKKLGIDFKKLENFVKRSREQEIAGLLEEIEVDRALLKDFDKNKKGAKALLEKLNELRKILNEKVKADKKATAKKEAVEKRRNENNDKNGSEKKEFRNKIEHESILIILEDYQNSLKEVEESAEDEEKKKIGEILKAFQKLSKELKELEREKNEGKSLESSENPQSSFSEINEEKVKDILKTFLDHRVGILRHFSGSEPQFPKPEEKITIEDSTFIQLSNEVLLDETFGWDKLLEWRREENESADSYSRLLTTIEQKKISTLEGSTSSFIEMPELGMGIKWLYRYKPSANWVNQYSSRFNGGEEFSSALSFLKKSVNNYGNTEIFKIKLQQAELGKAIQRNQIYLIFGLVSLALAIFAGVKWREARLAKEKAEIAQTRAFVSELGAKASEAEALKAESEAMKEKERAIKAKEDAIEAEKKARRADSVSKQLYRQAFAAKNKAESERLIAEASRLDAEAAKYRAAIAREEARNSLKLANKAKRESDSLKNLEYVRSISLTQINLIDDGQIDTVKSTLGNLLNNPNYAKVAEHNRQYYMALSKLLFHEQKGFSFSMPDGGGGVRAIVKNPLKKSFIVGNEAGNISSIQVSETGIANGNIKELLDFSGKHIRTLSLTNNEEYLIVGIWEGDIIVYDWKKSEEKDAKTVKEVDRILLNPWMGVRQVDVLSGTSTGIKLLVQLGSKKSDQGDSINIVTFDENKRKLKSIESIEIDGVMIDAVEADQDKKWIYIACRNKKIYLRNFDGKPLPGQNPLEPFLSIPNSKSDHKLDTLKRYTTYLKLSPTLSNDVKKTMLMGNAEKLLAIGLRNGNIYLQPSSPNHLWRSNMELGLPDAHYAQISGLDFYSEPGQLNLAIASFDRTGSLLDVLNLFQSRFRNSSEKIGERDVLLMKIHNQWIHALNYTNDGNQILTISEDGTVKLWFTNVAGTYNKIPLPVK